MKITSRQTDLKTTPLLMTLS